MLIWSKGPYALGKVGRQNEIILPDFCPRVFGFVVGVWDPIHFNPFGTV